ncbi:Na+/H+ antiporter subunit A [Corynebacterium gottingense]|uniref:Na+/H+ antiporter subunit A n=1 Tax=Corynebacterium gottingense TaxID=2041036 RepID=A0ABX9UKU0_9CORY|nr:Na+/H+ antiporter subunit A [Corynebacterium gottingense]RMD19963.1 Na+/H+ antiporter subunit A [Corynebacterium gottingense]WJZ13940.1 Na(+)/H(+) antiporter subunit A1 [Corynebacterium gottingense]WJZ16255.1 Na(+)/H(+) antiporter subunit A1 [Corynebacterium gottingense]
MLTLLAALIIATIAAPPLIRLCGRAAFGMLATVPLGGFIWMASLFQRGIFTDEGEIVASYAWMPSVNLNLEFRLDPLAGLFSLIILGVGALVLLYCWGYFDSNPRRLAKFGGELTMFATVMYGLVISDNFLLMYVFWELTSILSYLLVSYYGERASSRRAAIQALMITTMGGLAMLVGINLLGFNAGIWKLSQIPQFADIQNTPAISAAIVLIMLGALTKSAQAPWHFWLPGAMAAPTPVSAYLHSAAMVKAGIYLVARLAPDMAAVSTWHLVVISTGLFTMLLGGWMALKQRDLKLILAYGTVSQLGFITAVIGVGSREAAMAGLAITFAHSMFKATLFMIVGAIDHTTGTRDIRELSGLGRKEPFVAFLAVVSAASMAGLPPLFGFIAKESALEAILHEESLHGMPGHITLVVLVVGSILTMGYSLYFLWGAFATKAQHRETGVSPAVAKMHHIGPLLSASPAMLTLATIAFGLLPAWLSNAINSYLDVRFPHVEGAPLKLWHGITTPLVLTVVIVVAGTVLFWQRDLIRRVRFDKPALGDADEIWDLILHQLRNASLKLTASTQRGSLTINLAVIFATLMVVPLAALILGQSNDIHMLLWDNPWQGLVVCILCAMAIFATLQRNRLSGVVMVGLTGYSLAFIFALHGAPDLALTQALVETIVMVVFMLVLRKMPTEVEPRNDDNRLRAWLSIGTGLSVVIVAMTAMSARVQDPMSKYMPDLAYEIGHGRNTVNVLLVDLRAADTFGEILVLVIAATGVASLIFGTGTFGRESRRPTLSTNKPRWLASGVDSETAQNRSIMVDVVTRILFPSIMLLSFYFFFSGHNAPGGGFAGGLVAALAFTLRYLAGGRAEIDEALPVDPAKILGTGILLSAACVVVPLFFGNPPLTTGYASLALPLIGEFDVPSALVFDGGVYAIVVGLTLHILGSMGAYLDREEDTRKQRARDRARELQEKNKRRREQQAQRRAARESERASAGGAGSSISKQAQEGSK